MKTLNDYKELFLQAETKDDCFEVFIQFLVDFGMKDLAEVLLNKLNNRRPLCTYMKEEHM